MRYFVLGCMSFIILSSYTSNSHAKLIVWDENIPSSLMPFQQPEQLANLTKNNILIYAHSYRKTNVPTYKNKPQPNVQFVSAAIVLPVSAKQVAQTLTDYSNYVGLFPTLKSAKILEKNEQVSQVKYKVQIPTPIPVLNFNENITMQHQIGQNSLSTIIVDAPIRYGLGKFEWFELGPEKTLVTLTQWGDLNQVNGFLVGKILSAMPDIKLGIPVASNAFILESLQRKWSKPVIARLEQNQLPNLALNSSQIAKVNELSRSSGYPVSFIHPALSVAYPQNRESMRFTTTYQYYPKAASELRNWLNPATYQSLFPRQIKKIELSSPAAQQQDANFKVSVSLGVISIPFDFKMRFSHLDLNQSRFDAIGGDLRFVKGGIELLPQNNGTLLNLTTANKIDQEAPFLLRAMRSFPYHDMLPAAAGNAVFSLKIKEKMK